MTLNCRLLVGFSSRRDRYRKLQQLQVNVRSDRQLKVADAVDWVLLDLTVFASYVVLVWRLLLKIFNVFLGVCVSVFFNFLTNVMTWINSQKNFFIHYLKVGAIYIVKRRLIFCRTWRLHFIYWLILASFIWQTFMYFPIYMVVSFLVTKLNGSYSCTTLWIFRHFCNNLYL